MLFLFLIASLLINYITKVRGKNSASMEKSVRKLDFWFKVFSVFFQLKFHKKVKAIKQLLRLLFTWDIIDSNLLAVFNCF